MRFAGGKVAVLFTRQACVEQSFSLDPSPEPALFLRHGAGATTSRCFSICKPSFQAQAKRQKNRCMSCDNYTPHEHRSKAGQVFYLQSKEPACLAPHLESLPENVILVTTLETNRGKDYDKVSKGASGQCVYLP